MTKNEIEAIKKAHSGTMNNMFIHEDTSDRNKENVNLLKQYIKHYLEILPNDREERKSIMYVMLDNEYQIPSFNMKDLLKYKDILLEMRSENRESSPKGLGNESFANTWLKENTPSAIRAKKLNKIFNE